VTLASAINGTGSVTKTGVGTLTLTGTNGYGGGTAINGGTVAINTNASLGTAGTALSFNGGTLATTAAVDPAETTALAWPR